MDAETTKRLRAARFRAAREIAAHDPNFRMVYHAEVSRWTWTLERKQSFGWRPFWTAPWWYFEMGEIPKEPNQLGKKFKACRTGAHNVRA